MFRLNTISMAVMASLYLNTALAVPNNALPTGGQVTQGQAQIQQSMSQMQIQQQSQKAVIDWNSFNIGQQASVTFQQPNAQAATLNRVLNGSSEIAGQLNSNGQVYLLNPNGVLFSPTAQVNTGSLVVATATLVMMSFYRVRAYYNTVLMVRLSIRVILLLHRWADCVI
jgi:filamentous hemagglutinin family protein